MSKYSTEHQLAMQDETIHKLVDANITQTQALGELRNVCVQLNERCNILHQAIKALSEIEQGRR